MAITTRAKVTTAGSGGIALICGIIEIILYWRHGYQGDSGLQHWLALKLGINTAPSMTVGGQHYNFWSASGSDFGEVSIIAAVVSLAVTVIRKQVKHHAERMAQTERHHLAAMAQAGQHHDAQMALARTNHKALIAATSASRKSS